MEPIFKRSLLILVFCLMLWSCLMSPTSAKDNESVSAAVAAARKAGVPEVTVSRLLALGYEHGLKSGELENFLDITKAVHENGFPLGPFMSKIEEGLSKGVESGNISRVLHQELERFQFTSQLATQTMNSWKERNKGLRSEDLTRMSGTLAMGLSKKDMETFFSGVPRAPMNQIASALELMAGLTQSGLHQDEARGVIYAGLDSGFFLKPDWRLSIMVRVAAQKNISSDQITKSALGVVKGKMDVVEALQGLGLNPGALQQGPYYGSPQGSSSGPSNGHGPSGGPGEGSGGGGPEGSGGGNGGGGPGGGGGSMGGMH